MSNTLLFAQSAWDSILQTLGKHRQTLYILNTVQCKGEALHVSMQNKSNEIIKMQLVKSNRDSTVLIKGHKRSMSGEALNTE